MLSKTYSAPFPPCPTPFNLAAHVLGRADALDDKIALAVVGLSGSERWSYGKLKSAVLGTGTGLLRTGLNPGDRVLMRLGNCVEFPIAYLGAIAVGVVPVVTSSQLTERETEAIIETVSPKLILRDPDVPCPSTTIPEIDAGQLSSLRDLEPATWQMADPNRPAYIIFTSGTAGVPRAVVHAHRAIWARQMMFAGWYGLTEDDRLMHAGAFNWTYTLGTGLMDPWTIGATALIPTSGIAPEQLPLLLRRHDVTIFAAAPGVYRKITKGNKATALPKLRHGLTAGEKLSETIRASWKDTTGTELFEAYGMSECSTFVSSSPDHPAAEGTLGRPQPGRQIALLNDAGPVEIGAEGTIAVHRDDPGLMLGYLDAEDDTNARMQGDWFLTGDQGVMDAEGNITYLGRADDMMNAGGYRVSPMEVEAVLNAHPAITQSAVTDIEVKQDARLIMAFYTASSPVAEADLTTYVEKNLAAYKQPRGFFHVDALPTGANGKLLRRALRPIYEALNGQA